MNEEQQKAIKALEAAVRKAQRAGMTVRTTYTYSTADNGTRSTRIREDS